MHSTLAALLLPLLFSFPQAPVEPGAAPAATPAAAVAPAEDSPLAKVLAAIAADELKDDVGWLADDERKGRCAGEPGCDDAAEWIADRFDDLGLEPIGDEGTFLQRFTFRVRGAGGGREASTQNVVGLWKGSDPELADEVIVLGAHYDHVGTLASFDAGRIGSSKGDDGIWNGADDNASGTSTLIGIAHAFASSDVRPGRSLLFIAFSGEEQGLFGSIWYCDHPIVPLEKTAAMINLDMVGRNPKQPVETWAVGSLEGDLWKKLIDASRPVAPTLELALQASWMPDSDHASFLAKEVPALFLCTGEHPDYHTVSDHADKLDYDRMAAVARLATAITWNAAESRATFQFTRPAFQPRPPKLLGVSTEGALTAEQRAKLGLKKEQGAFLVQQLDPAGVGAKAGLKDGDVILSIAGKPLDADDPVTSLRRLIGGAERGKDVPIVVRRGEEELTLNARWN
jgi:hypothetical protein